MIASRASVRLSCSIILAALVFSGCVFTDGYDSDRGIFETFVNLSQVTFHEEDDTEPSICTADGSMLFVSSRGGNRDIYLTRSNSRAVVQKTSHRAYDINPTFSPDGTRFAFSSNRNGNYDIFVMNVDRGKAKVQLTDSGAHDITPDWSPDGSLIAFTRISPDAEPYVWTKNLESGELTQVAQGASPRFSRDGERLLYKKSGPDGYFELWIMDIDGEHDTQIVSSPDWGIRSFSWSPDGRGMIFSASKRTPPLGGFDYGDSYSGWADLWTVRVDGTHMTQITSQRGMNVDPQWTSGGWVYFVSDREDAVNIWRFRLEVE